MYFSVADHANMPNHLHFPTPASAQQSPLRPCHILHGTQTWFSHFDATSVELGP